MPSGTALPPGQSPQAQEEGAAASRTPRNPGGREGAPGHSSRPGSSDPHSRASVGALLSSAEQNSDASDPAELNPPGSPGPRSRAGPLCSLAA